MADLAVTGSLHQDNAFLDSGFNRGGRLGEISGVELRVYVSKYNPILARCDRSGAGSESAFLRLDSNVC